MLEEPYRWIEAVRNRREYLEEQLASGSPIVAFPYQDGILMATCGAGTPKLYEVYDQIAFGGLGHPTDLEKLRTVVLEIAHIEGFNRSPADVNLQRLIKFGIAPAVKQAFEEILHAPYTAKLLFAELPHTTGHPLFLNLNYDGMFEENEKFSVLAPMPRLGALMEKFLQARGETVSLSLKSALQVALRTWAISLLPSHPDSNGDELPDISQLDALLMNKLNKLTPEVSLLDRNIPGTSKYRSLTGKEILSLINEWLPK